jgi:1,4-dihydroxy-2-naphthoate octaprenyltransferase
MDSITPSFFKLLVRIVRPWSLLAGALTYMLGAGIAKYLGFGIHVNRFWLGLLAVILLLMASYALKAYYDRIDADSPLHRTQKDLEDEEQKAVQRLTRQSLLLIAFTILTAGAAFTVLLIADGAIQFASLIILAIAFLLAFFYGVPPFRLAYSGYGELSEGIIFSGLIPALAYLLQTGDLHRLLLMLSFPLLALFLAMRLAQSLELYAHDQKLGRRTLIIQIGWLRGMALHNILILGGYLLLVVAAAIGLPWVLTWPGLLTLPVGIFQIYLMNQISAGAKPDWRLLKLTAAATFALTAYLLTLASWTG